MISQLSCRLLTTALLLVPIYSLGRTQTTDSYLCDFGTSQETANFINNNTDGGLYINVADPAPCDGNVTTLVVCVNPLVKHTNSLFHILRAVLYRNNTDENSLFLVAEEKLLFKLTSKTASTCFSDILSDTWSIKAGDYLGVFIFNKCMNISTFHLTICPASPLIEPQESTPANSMLFHPDFLETLPISNLTTSSSGLNIRAVIETDYGNPPETRSIVTTVLAVIIPAVLVLVVILVTICLYIKYSGRKKIYPQRMACNAATTLSIHVNERGILRRTRSSHHWTIARTQSINNECSGPSTTTLDESVQYDQPDLLISGNYEQLHPDDREAPVFSPAAREVELKQQLVELGVQEIPLEQLQFEEELGKGHFSKVYKALWTGIVSSRTGTLNVSARVAVKVMEDGSTLDDRIKFLQEAVLLGQFDDPNIVAVFGVITETIKLMIVCELMDENLREHLIAIQTSVVKKDSEIRMSELPALLLSYCRKIASSLVYLGLRGFVHRDLAARNILISKEGDCKLSDFGLSRYLSDDSYYQSGGGLVPVKWTAPEAIYHKKYSPASDVWSYGILLYEIWSLGHKPYEGMGNIEVVRKIETGYRLPPPPGCPRSIYELIIKCTHPQAESRPTFTSILTSLQRPDYQLLKWAAEDVAGSSEAARMLGGPLEEGQSLYTQLQNTYIEGTVETSM